MLNGGFYFADSVSLGNSHYSPDQPWICGPSDTVMYESSYPTKDIEFGISYKVDLIVKQTASFALSNGPKTAMFL